MSRRATASETGPLRPPASRRAIRIYPCRQLNPASHPEYPAASRCRCGRHHRRPEDRQTFPKHLASAPSRYDMSAGEMAVRRQHPNPTPALRPRSSFFPINRPPLAAAPTGPRLWRASDRCIRCGRRRRRNPETTSSAETMPCPAEPVAAALRPGRGNPRVQRPPRCWSTFNVSTKFSDHSDEGTYVKIHLR